MLGEPPSSSEMAQGMQNGPISSCSKQEGLHLETVAGAPVKSEPVRYQCFTDLQAFPSNKDIHLEMKRIFKYEMFLKSSNLGLYLLHGTLYCHPLHPEFQTHLTQCPHPSNPSTRHPAYCPHILLLSLLSLCLRGYQIPV